MSEIADRIGPYRLLTKLGEGGMGVVYLALEDGADELCVLKRTLTATSAEETRLRRFRREAVVARYLDHPNIARTLGTCSADGAEHIAMEYVPGVDLERLMQRHHGNAVLLPYEVTLRIADAALDALGTIHGQVDEDGRPLGLVHRDLSPRNLMLSFAGRVVIIDFGLVKADLGDFQTRPGITFGTFQYVSPEQVRAEPTDGRSDLYALALSLYEAFCGRAAIPYQAELRDLLIAAAMPKIQHLRDANPALSSALCEVVMKALAPAPADRWQSAAEMRAALRAATGALELARPEEVGPYVSSMFKTEAEQAAAYVRQAKIWAKKQASDRDSVPVRPRDINAYEEFVRLTEVDQPVRSASRLAPVPLSVTATASATAASAEQARDRPRRSRLMMGAALGLSAAIVAAIALGEGLRRQDPAPPTAVEPTAPVPVAVAKSVPSQTPPPVIPAPAEPEARAPVRPRNDTKIPPPPEKATKTRPAPEPRDELKPLIRQLQRNLDPELFQRAHTELLARINELPADRRSGLESKLDAARMNIDPVALEEVLELIERRRE